MSDNHRSLGQIEANSRRNAVRQRVREGIYVPLAGITDMGEQTGDLRYEPASGYRIVRTIVLFFVWHIVFFAFIIVATLKDTGVELYRRLR